MKTICKIFVWLMAILAAVAGIAYLEKKSTPEYIEIYSDDEEGLF